MARLVLISPYLKGGRQAPRLANLTRYLATRPGAEKPEDRPGRPAAAPKNPAGPRPFLAGI